MKIIIRTESPGKKDDKARVHREGQQQQHKDFAWIRKDMRPQEFATQGFAPHQICGTLSISRKLKESSQ